VLARSGLQLKDKLPGGDITIAEALMAPTTIYVKQVIYNALDILYCLVLKLPPCLIWITTFILETGA
jgi:hypothetical protein